jgi:hypothetical protein
VPFPISGTRAFDKAGRPLQNNATIAVEGIYGVRLVGFLNQQNHSILRFSVSDSEGQGDSTSIRIAAPQDSRRINVRLVDYLPVIRRLLAATPSLDSFVQVELNAGDAEAACLRIARYPTELNRDVDHCLVYIASNGLGETEPCENLRITARAMRLDSLNDEPLELACKNDPRFAIAWSFPVEELGSGPWLIYPGKESQVFFRPMLWTIGQTAHPALEASGATFGAVAGIADADTRLDAYRSVICRLAMDFDDTDWAVLEQFANELSHLPMSTLDAWRAFSLSADGMCALAFRTGSFPSNFFERFASEMPCVWETVPLMSWIRAMDSYRKHMGNNTVLRPCLENRTEVIASFCNSLRALLELAQSFSTGHPTQEVLLAATGAIDFYQQLFNGADSPYQVLLRECAEAQWPRGLEAEIMQGLNASARQLIRTEEVWFRKAVVHLPILLAVSVLNDSTNSWWDPNRLRTLRRFQDFCPDWFSDAFNLTVARCIAEKGLMRLQG